MTYNDSTSLALNTFNPPVPNGRNIRLYPLDWFLERADYKLYWYDAQVPDKTKLYRIYANLYDMNGNLGARDETTLGALLRTSVGKYLKYF